jgi:hypothetical protein
MRRKKFEDYLPAGMEPLKILLADIYLSLKDVSRNLYLVGGLVPEFLVTNKLSYLREYLGTLDIDLAIELAASGNSRFKNLYDRLRGLGFEKQKTDDGLDFMNHSFVKHEYGNREVILDLIVDDKFEPKVDKLKEISPNVEAAKMRGVYLVFTDYIRRDIKGSSGEMATIKIANLIPFITLKSFVYMDPDNGSAKDAFDIWYTIVNYEEGPDSVNREASRYRDNPNVRDALKAIKEFFNDETSRGTKDVVDILVRRYGLDRSRANREVVTPLRLVKGI